MKIIKFVRDFPLPAFDHLITDNPVYRKGEIVKIDNWRAKRFTKKGIDWEHLEKTGRIKEKNVLAYVIKDLGNYHGGSKRPCYIICKEPISL